MGLSPRRRGNRWASAAADTRMGSIPAQAGEPAAPDASMPTRRVYPRAGGGTPAESWNVKLNGGLSPRRRGNLRSTFAAMCQCRLKSPQKCRSKIPQFRGCGSTSGIGVLLLVPGWSAAPFGRRGRRDGRVGADVFGDEVGVFAQPVAGAFDVDDDGVVEQSVEQGGGDDGIAEQLAPFREAAVGGEDHGALLVAGVDELEEQVGGAAVDGDVADLVDDEQRGAGEEADLLGEAVLAPGLGEGLDEFREGRAVDALSGLDGGDAERDGEMALAGAGRAEQMDHLGAVDEVELGERQDAVPVEGRLEGEVEALERLRRVQPGGLEGDADAAVLADVELLGEQRVDGFEGADLAAFETLDDVGEGLQRG